MLRLLLKAFLLFALAAVVYVASPFYAAWSLREAVTQGDSAFLTEKVQWHSVRETMRSSMLLTALDLPDPDAAAAVSAEPPPRRGFFKRLKARLKAYAGRRVVDKMVDQYVSAEGLPRLYRARLTQKSMIEGADPDPVDWKQRFERVWARILKAEFRTATQFEIELQDQFSAERSYVAQLEFREMGWILTELRIRSLKGIEAVALDRRVR